MDTAEVNAEDFAAEEGYDVTPTKEKKAAQKANRAPKADR
jgi:hypothetical protein